MDTVDKLTRSRIMARVRSKNTAPELKFRKGLFACGFRYRIHGKLPGKPDLVFPKYRAAIFINGCFWHGHQGCKRSRLPSTNVDYWAKKIARNVSNESNNIGALHALGWRVMVVWECEMGAGLRTKLDEAAEWLKSAD